MIFFSAGALVLLLASSSISDILKKLKSITGCGEKQGLGTNEMCSSEIPGGASSTGDQVCPRKNPLGIA
ncbi:hypothetical protein RchiOBHm_Chr2g0132291 [Rosa chinensis]|uniref:Uncharacterized protein n=1 Tax=Rosa chinensis TaxID=74649 RepID=A0A2P6RVB3_ROSCH|nr:hypothetical protein RchiOBHm_Chr2g0132291 [Rosa chinensis]